MTVYRFTSLFFLPLPRNGSRYFLLLVLYGFIRSASGDADILILAIFVFYEVKHRITIDSISAKKRKHIWFGEIELTEEYVMFGISRNTCIQWK